MLSSRGNLLKQEIEPASLTSPALAVRFFTTSTTWEAHKSSIQVQNNENNLIYWGENILGEFFSILY